MENSSDHLKKYTRFNVEIITTGANTTAYHIKQTQGAEFGDEAEVVRALFESELNKIFGKNIEAEAECDECDWTGDKDEMEENEYEEGEFIAVCPDCGSDKIYYHK